MTRDHHDSFRVSHVVGLATALLTAVVRLAPAAAAETLFVAEPFTPRHAFTPGIEGPACDRSGAVFAVNYERQGTIGRVAPDGSAEVHLALPGTSIGNGIRFAADGTMFIADYVNHNVLKVAPGGTVSLPATLPVVGAPGTAARTSSVACITNSSTVAVLQTGGTSALHSW